MKEKSATKEPPTTMTVGGRTYEVLCFPGRGKNMTDRVMLKRAEQAHANLGEEEGSHILDHQEEIPRGLRDFAFVFPDWRCRPHGSAACIYFCGHRWLKTLKKTDDNGGCFRWLRRRIEIPTTMTVGGRTYDILGFLKEGETFVQDDVIVARAKKMNANLGEDDALHILKHQNKIPAALRGKVVLVFTDRRHPGSPGRVRYIRWRGSRWIKDWSLVGGDWCGRHRFLRKHS